MEISNIIACDRAFGAHLTKCPWQSRHRDMQLFQARPAKEKIVKGENEDPLSFLKNVAKAVTDKKAALPIIGYYREAGFSPDTMTTVEKPLKTVIRKEDSDKEYPIELAYLELNYQILIVAATRMEIQEVSLPLYRYLRDNRYFMVNYRFFYKDPDSGDGFAHPARARIIDPRLVAYSDLKVNVPAALPQLFAARASYEVRCPLIFMEKAEPVEEEIELLDITALVA